MGGKGEADSLALWKWMLEDKQLGARWDFSKAFLVHVLNYLYSHSCHPASPSTAASAMLGGHPCTTTARPARWTETSAASSLGLVLRLCSVSTLQAPSIVGSVPQVCGCVRTQLEAPTCQPGKVPEPASFRCWRIRRPFLGGVPIQFHVLSHSLPLPTI